MKTLLLVALVTLNSLSSFAASTENVETLIASELKKIQLQLDERDTIVSTNRIIRIGEPAINLLQLTLLNPQTSLKIKWIVARALGEIGSPRALPSLNACLRDSKDELKEMCRHSVAQVTGEAKRFGKLYLYNIEAQVTRTDLETGTTEVVQ